ncbi:terminase large subunit domain-containing protein [Mycolicibacterium sp. NCC-Tsukiji]|uniref:terminase large subunit domain-containing protein n=1 Tax=Mycolicibacterium sp. NCC-Tsukiji TaxID=2185272 RepID=UPI001FCEC780|nr:terminase large subunit [Mycolicibacterium sp. NCC-Tsukiji]
MRSGNKGKLENGDVPLPFRPTSEVESERFVKFCEKFVRVPKGTNAKGVFRPREWQMDIVRDVLDSGARTVGEMLPRGSGKTTLNAAIALYVFFTWGEGANVDIFAVDERQAGLAFSAAKRIVELSDELSSRCYVYADKLVIPLTDSTFQVMPASPAAAEGRDSVLTIVDEAGVVNRDLYEVVALCCSSLRVQRMASFSLPVMSK